MFGRRWHGIGQDYGWKLGSTNDKCFFPHSHTCIAWDGQHCFHLIYDIWAKEDWDRPRVWKLKYSFSTTGGGRSCDFIGGTVCSGVSK